MITLRPYQITLATMGLDILREHGIVYYAMQTRTGKTHVALHTARQHGAESVLFITKKKAIRSIFSDYEAGEYRFKLQIINYEQLHNVTAGNYLYICDEAHGLGAYPLPSLRTKRLRSMIGMRPLILLSGTPTPESYSQLYHQLWISGRSPFPHLNFYYWAHEYVKITQEKRGAYLVNNYSDADKERIMAVAGKLIVSFTQESAGFKCPVQEHFLEVDDSTIVCLQKKIFSERVIKLFDREMILHTCVADTPASLIGKMHQLAGGSVICDDATVTVSEKKAEFIKEYFSGKRIAIFYKYIGERAILEKHFPLATISPEDFQAHLSDTFLSQICSGREGIALHSADCIVMYAIDFAAVSYFQARARIQDLHRDNPAQMYWIFYNGSIEKKIYKAVNEKKDFTLSYFLKSGGFR